MRRAAALLLLLAACGGGGGDEAAGGSTTTGGDATTTTAAPGVSVTPRGPMDPVPEATTTTEPAATTTTEPDDGGEPPVTADPAQCREAGADPSNPEPAAQAVFIAWTRDDVECARVLMTDLALSELFARDGSQARDIFQGCFESDEGDPHIDCAFSFEGGATHYLMNFSDTEGWKVFDITQFAD